MTAYRQHWNSTLDNPIYFTQEYWHNQVIKAAHQLVLIMGEDNYNRWCDANLPDVPVDWQNLYKLLEAKYQQQLIVIQLEELDHQEQMRKERPR